MFDWFQKSVVTLLLLEEDLCKIGQEELIEKIFEKMWRLVCEMIMYIIKLINNS